jgi:hypothetical protein
MLGADCPKAISSLRLFEQIGKDMNDTALFSLCADVCLGPQWASAYIHQQQHDESTTRSYECDDDAADSTRWPKKALGG